VFRAEISTPSPEQRTSRWNKWQCNRYFVFRNKQLWRKLRGRQCVTSIQFSCQIYNCNFIAYKLAKFVNVLPNIFPSFLSAALQWTTKCCERCQKNASVPNAYPSCCVYLIVRSVA
jgi:hypothetical protein